MVKAFQELTDDISTDDDDDELEGFDFEVNTNTTARLPCIIHFVVSGLGYVFDPSNRTLAILGENSPDVLAHVQHLLQLITRCREVGKKF
jgi:hypothetical protein